MTVTVRPVQAEEAEAIQTIYAPVVRDIWISFEFNAPSVEGASALRCDDCIAAMARR